jgi:ribonuclease P protein component
LALPASKTHDFSFPKNVRLRQRAEFVRLSQTGVKLSSRYFIVLIGNELVAVSRLGITVSKKVGCAVVRNRVKRVLREQLRLQREIWPTSDFVVIARSAAAKASFDEITRDISSLLQRVMKR